MRFSGYAAVFNQPDSGGDIIRPGAFTSALGHAHHLPLLWQHRPAAVIGEIEHLLEDSIGLRVIARLSESCEGRRAARLIEATKIDGLSFGYRTRVAGKAAGLRELIEVDLVEISLVAAPMQVRARVQAIDVMGWGYGSGYRTSRRST